MQPPATPPDEQTRLDTLRSLNLLDTAPEERFDRLTRLARRMFGVPISLVSLVDADRQWFKSNQGLDATETPREVSFCGHAILGDEVFVVQDTQQDERFADNPLVLDSPSIRFYAGCPLRVVNGSKLGTLCLIDQQPREFSDEDREILRDLAIMAEQEIAAVQLATLDELTMISNRRGFFALAQHALNVCRRKGHTATLMYFDMDGFKAINDRFGHAEGDRALVAFAGLMREQFRDSDVIARMGGDEFVALVTDHDQQAIRTIGERFAKALADYNAKAQRGYDLAYSLGAVDWMLDADESVEELMRRADVRMYAAKEAARGGAKG